MPAGVRRLFPASVFAEESVGILGDAEQVAAMILHTNDAHVAFEDNIGYTMFKEADILTMTMMPDNEMVIRYIEEYLGGVIPENYREDQGHILK